MITMESGKTEVKKADGGKPAEGQKKVREIPNIVKCLHKFESWHGLTD